MTWRFIFSARSESSKSKNAADRAARIPISSTARAVPFQCQYMSEKNVVPDLIISRHASLAPQ